MICTEHILTRNSVLNWVCIDTGIETFTVPVVPKVSSLTYEI